MTKLTGRVAIIFGGSSGIGKATALLFGREAARVAVVASGHLDKAQAVVDEIETAGGTGRAYAVDIRDVDAIRALVKKVEQDLGPIDILVNSAGVYYPTLIGEVEERDYDRMADINLKGTFFTIDAVTPGMKARGRGHIVNVASVAGVRASARFPLYSATKAAIIMLTKSLGGALAPHGIHVNAIAPGNTATPLNIGERQDEANQELMASKAAVTPSQRVYSPPEEMAASILFLCAGDVNALYGATLVIDEGLSTCV
jgi:NAD(P)-dependent dehydrogenase (short-subunit alcohol dehydrogenase family)